jgi:hypothetical protein
MTDVWCESGDPHRSDHIKAHHDRRRKEHHPPVVVVAAAAAGLGSRWNQEEPNSSPMELPIANSSFRSIDSSGGHSFSLHSIAIRYDYSSR